MGPAQRRVAFHTFGCKLNQFETEALAASFRTAGFLVVRADEEADVYLLNTCTVTSRADHKARSLIRGLARAYPRAPLLVTGCSAQTEAEALSELAPSVVVIPQSEKSRLLMLPGTLAETLDQGDDPAARIRESLKAGLPGDPFAVAVTDFSFHTRAFLKIQDGCDCNCAYCRAKRLYCGKQLYGCLFSSVKQCRNESYKHQSYILERNWNGLRSWCY